MGDGAGGSCLFGFFPHTLDHLSPSISRRRYKVQGDEPSATVLALLVANLLEMFLSFSLTSETRNP